MKKMFPLFFLFVTYVFSVVATKTGKVLVNYPIELMQPVTGSSFDGIVVRDVLTCFGNRDYGVPNFFETLGCMIYLPGFSCIAIWGSRSVLVTVDGSAEFLRVHRLPRESVAAPYTHLAVTRWLQVVSTSNKKQKEVKRVPVEPLYLCARCNDWRKNATANISVEFRPMYLRERDRSRYVFKMLLHMGILFALSSLSLMPYLVALVCGAFAYLYGMNHLLASVAVSCCVVLFTPLMLTRKNRHITRNYFRNLFTRIQVSHTVVLRVYS